MKKPSKTDLKTINGLAEFLGADRRTLRRALSGVRPVKRGRLRLYPVSIAVLALATRRQREQSGPLARLKAARLAKQVELLRLKLAGRQSELISRTTVEKMLRELHAATGELLRRKLETEYPLAAANREPAELRVLGKRFVDEICVGMQQTVQSWKSEDSAE